MINKKIWWAELETRTLSEVANQLKKKFTKIRWDGYCDHKDHIRRDGLYVRQAIFWGHNPPKIDCPAHKCAYRWERKNLKVKRRLAY